jgi:hypothetical protein
MGIGRGFIANVASRADFTTDNTIDEYWEMAVQPLCIGSWIDACSKWHRQVFLEGFICVWLVDRVKEMNRMQDVSMAD